MKKEKQIDCSRVKERILLGEKLNADEELHLLGCGDCQAFAQAQQMLLEPQLAPSAELDSRVLASVKASRRQPARLHGWVGRSVAAAASIVLVCYLAFALTGRRDRVTTSGKNRMTQIHCIDQDSMAEYNLAPLSSMTLEYALADNELDRLEIALEALSFGNESPETSAESGVEGARRLDYDIISLEMDMFYDL